MVSFIAEDRPLTTTVLTRGHKCLMVRQPARIAMRDIENILTERYDMKLNTESSVLGSVVENVDKQTFQATHWISSPELTVFLELLGRALAQEWIEQQRVKHF